MFLRVAGLSAVFTIGLAGDVPPAAAQFFPPPPAQILPPPPPPRYLGAPPVPPADIEAEDRPTYAPPPVYVQPLPPPPEAPAYVAPPQYGRAYPAEPDVYPPPPPVYRALPPGYEPVDPASRPAFGAAPAMPSPLDVPRPPGAVGPGEGPRMLGGSTNSIYSNLPPEERPEVGPAKELPPQFRRTEVDYRSREPAGTIIIDTPNTYLYLVLGNGRALRYGIGVGREGFTWTGTERISKMAEWPDWNPPAEMIERQPYLPRFMAGGEGNPLGARALYLGKTLYRIHGTNQPSTIGSFVSSGCIRLTNDDIADLYGRVQVGTRVVVLPGRAPATASAAPVAGPTASSAAVGSAAAVPQPYNPLAPPPRR
jgi:lipoprotein-anchoring transpeptidase ErfK/SrfK